ncbi:MAG: hypothetical protein ACKODX_15370 [Gemmata sp.]
MDSFDQLYGLLKHYGAGLALALTWVGVVFAWWRRRGQWRRKEFLGQVNFSLNLFGDTLAMRTLLEVETNEVWPNAHGVKLLHSAAVRTTVADPFIKLPVQADRDFLHRAVKNALSELCPAAFVATALGHPVKTGKFLFAVTCERYPEMRTVKLRVLLVEEGTLREWCAPGGRADQLPMSEYYKTRLRTLQAMYAMDQRAKAGGPEVLGRVELGVPV